MRLKFIAILILTGGLFSFQKESDVQLTVGDEKSCLERKTDIPVIVRYSRKIEKEGGVVLTGNGITLTYAGQADGERKYVGRIASNGDSVRIMVSVRNEKEKTSTLLYRRAYAVCPVK